MSRADLPGADASPAAPRLLEEVDARIEANWQRQLDFIADLVRSPSVLGREAAAQRKVARELAGMGLEPELWEIDHAAIAREPGYSPAEWSYEGRPNVTARWRGSGGGRSLILNGHIDVVPVAPEGFWTCDPWGAEVRDGRMYGRGAADMKSGIGAMIFAVRALREAGVTLCGDVLVESVIEEECTGNGALATLVRGYTADAAIIPEPFNHTLLIAQVGVLWARVTVRGAGAHVLGADKAVNAIEKAMPLIAAVRELEREANERKRPAPFHDLAHPINYNVGTIRAGDWPSSVPSECTFEVRIGAFPGDDLAAVQEGFRERLLEAARHDPWLAAHPPEVRFFGFQAEGCMVDADAPVISTLAAAHEEVHGRPAESYVSTATTDVRFFNLYRGIPATCYGPVGGALHAPDEWVDLASVKQVTRVLARAAVGWCGLG